MSKSKLYTKGGDKGETSLASGTRVLKSDTRIDAYGDVDELNSSLGYLVSQLESKKINYIDLMQSIQNELFNLGSNLATESDAREKYKIPKISPEIINSIEKAIDTIDQQLPKLKNFILPGGDQAAAWCHCCRTVCRRVERKLVKYCKENNDEIDFSLEFINRLSDFFFAYARYINFKNQNSEIEWKK